MHDEKSFGQTDRTEKGSGYFASLLFFLVFGLRGWGGVFSIFRKTSSGFGSVIPRLRGFLPVIGKPSESQENDEDLKIKTKLLLSKAECTYYATLASYEYGMPYAHETVLKNILRELVKLDLINLQKIEKVLQFLPQNPEYLSE
jgi:hypothetical protein